jgi:hypothetical protein
MSSAQLGNAKVIALVLVALLPHPVEVTRAACRDVAKLWSRCALEQLDLTLAVIARLNGGVHLVDTPQMQKLHHRTTLREGAMG